MIANRVTATVETIERDALFSTKVHSTQSSGAVGET
jgi:hypothetical protein